MAGKLNTSTTTDAGTDTTLIGLILRPIEITLCVLFLWFGSMLLMMFLFDVTEKALIIGDPMEILAKLDGEAEIVRISENSVVLKSTKPGFSRHLYQNGAWLVLPSLKSGCLDLRTKSV